MDEIFKILTRHKDESVVIFSQWTTLLDVIEFALQQKKITQSRFDGKTPVPKRQKALQLFENKGKVISFISSY